MTTPANPDDLTAWLHAALNDDAALIERNSGQRGITDEGIFPDYRTYDGEDLNAADAYLVGFNPKRMLAEVDAKRQRLAVIERDLADDPTDETAQYLLRLDLLPYADRPGYREEWRP